MDKQTRKAIKERFADMPKDVERAGRLASWDLWNGPLTCCEECGSDSLSTCACEHPYPGFQRACDVVSRWADENVGTLYLEIDTGYVSSEEPQGEEIDGEYVEPLPYYVIERGDILAALFGRELASYL